MFKAALPHPDAVRHIAEQPGSDVADRVHRRPRSHQSSTGGASTSAASGSRSRGTAKAAGSATGHHVRVSALPSRRPAAMVPAPASLAASGHGSIGVRGEPACEQHSRRTDDRGAGSLMSDVAASQAAALHPDIETAGTEPGWRSSSGAAEVP